MKVDIKSTLLEYTLVFCSHFIHFRMAVLMAEKQKEAQEQTVKAGQELQSVVTSTRQLQQQVRREAFVSWAGVVP